MSSSINWADIMAECGNYRDGFVAIFKRYEGQLTDEKDSQNRTIKVTAKSFAEHVGVDPRTFQRWVKKSEMERRAVAPPPRSKNDLTRDVQRAARHEPDAVVDGILAAPESTQEAIFDELKLRRAGVDTSKANRKAAHANAHQAAQPHISAIARTQIVLCISALHDAADCLRQAKAEGVIDEEALSQIRTASAIRN